MTIIFDHELTPAAQSDFEELYCRHPLIIRVLFGAASICMLTLVFHPRETLFDRVLLLPPIVLFGLVATERMGVWYRWWWRRMEPTFAAGQSGEINGQGVCWTADDVTILWSSFQGAKVNASTVLLYLNNWYPLPLHRSMFASEADWQSFCALLTQSGVRIRRFHRRGRVL